MWSSFSSPIPAFQLPTRPSDIWSEQAWEDLYEQNVNDINDADLEDILSKKIDVLSGEEGEAEMVALCSDSYGPVTPSGIAIIYIASLDLNFPATKQRDDIIVLLNRFTSTYTDDDVTNFSGSISDARTQQSILSVVKVENLYDIEKIKQLKDQTSSGNALLDTKSTIRTT